MADEATPQGATQTGAPVSANPAVATQPATTAQPVQEPAYEGGFTKADFEHPEYGPKARNLYKGFQEATTRKAEIERAAEADRKAIAELRELVTRNPDLKEAITAAYEGRPLRKPEPVEAVEETEEQKLRREISEDIESKQRAATAMQETYLRLGNGNQLEGRKIFDEKYRKAVNDNLDRLNRATSADLIDIAMKLAQSETAPITETKPAPVAPAAPEPAVSGESRGDGGTGPAEVAPKSDSPEYLAYVLRKSGFSDAGQYLSASGAFGN